ncbi:hypothetical protein GGS24DRAFT_190077 [Hypoxylon argillaceum]|nr:hypothetical protein GGS24DRAFT_190077 [Hypoxylon argillaceum]
MQFLTTILMAILLTLGASTPVPPPASSPATARAKEWTLDTVSRTRTNDKQTCHWAMTITQSPTTSSPPWPTTNSTAAPVHCAFRVQDKTDCGTAAFGLTRCSPQHHGFYVSGGHDAAGFVILLVTDVDEDAQAFFGYLDSTLDSGNDIPPQTSPVDDRY